MTASHLIFYVEFDEERKINCGWPEHPSTQEG